MFLQQTFTVVGSLTIVLTAAKGSQNFWYNNEQRKCQDLTFKYMNDTLMELCSFKEREKRHTVLYDLTGNLGPLWTS